MRRSLVLLKRQDVCSLCAFRPRYGAERSSPVRQTRCYQVSRPVAAPANTAVAQQEEDDEHEYPELPATPLFKRLPSRTPLVEPPPKAASNAINVYESSPDWKCPCGHANLPKNSKCSTCDEPRRKDAQLHYPTELRSRRVSRATRTSEGLPPQPPEKRLFRTPLTSKGEFSPVKRLAKRENILGGFRAGVSLEEGWQEQPPPLKAEKRLDGIGHGFSLRQEGQHEQELRSKAENRFGGFDRRQEGHSRTITNSYVAQGFGSFLDSLSEKTHTPNRKLDAAQPPTRSNRGPPLQNQTFKLGSNISSRGKPSPLIDPRQETWRHRPADVGRLDEPVQFTPFIRKMKPRQDPGTGKIWDTNNEARPLQYTSTDSPLAKMGSDEAVMIMPPAASSFDNFADERRKKRNDRLDRRSQRFEIEDADGNDMQNAASRDKSSSNRRGSQQEIDDAELLMEDEFEERRKKKSRKKAPVVQSRPTLQLPDFISVEQLSRILKVRVDQFLRKLEEEGFEGARYDHILDAESSAMIADAYGFEASFGGRQTLDDLMPQPEAEDKSLLPSRPPVVTIMGHVDHGKTTILDWLRKSSVVATEHGGITQHIGAFSVKMPGSERQITFLDTPGHAAFLDMRRRGAVVTDIVVLVVAADDSVKPQTIEAIKHALEAKVHIIVAINKVDKEDANVTRVKQDLAANGITVEEYGGDYQAIELSGKTGMGMEELEEAILTLADVSDFRADIDGRAEGWILESKVTPAGRVATILVRQGTLRVHDFIVAGTTWARVKTLRNDAGILVDEALPGTPVQVDGWRGEDPTAGLEVLQADDEEHAKDVVDIRLERIESQRIAGDLAAMNSTRTEEAAARAKVLAWEAEQTWTRKKRKPTDNEGWVEVAAAKGAKLVHFVVKADVAGSVEALVAAVSAVGDNEIRANVIHSGTGLLSESDIRHLAATGETAYAISFNQPVDGTISQLARAAGLQILDHNIIYKVTDDVKEKLSAELPPLITQRVLGEAEIGKVFEISTKQGKVKIAGCKINNGSISRSHRIRVLRNGDTVYTGKLDSLKNVKKDVNEMRKGSECGMGFSNWEDFEEGDQVQTFEEERTTRKLY